MSDIKASVKFDMAKPAVAATKDNPAKPATPDSATVTLELVGLTEMEHELLVQFFKARSVSLVPFNVGDKLETRFVIADDGAFARAQRATENRIRTRNGQPTVEQEEARNAANRPAQTVGHQLQNEANKQLTPPPPYSPKKVN